MKKNLFSKILFWLLIAGASLGLATAVWRTMDYYFRFHLPLFSVWFLLKGIVFASVLLIGYCLFELKRIFEQQGFLTQWSVARMRLIGSTTFVMAIANSAFNVWRDEVILPKLTQVPTTGHLANRFFFDFLFESPTMLFLSMLIFLLAAFVERAILIKNENETFI